VNAVEFAAGLPDDRPIVFTFGALSHGHIKPEYTEKCIKLSNYPLSGANAVCRLLSAIEHQWDIL
jgi:rRNA small subunit pseudouridine methyltransferase Nep1